MGAFCLCRARTRQQNAPIYNRAVLNFDDLFALFGITVSTDAHPRAPARSRRVTDPSRVAPRRAAPQRAAPRRATPCRTASRLTPHSVASHRALRHRASSRVAQAQRQSQTRARADALTCRTRQKHLRRYADARASFFRARRRPLRCKVPHRSAARAARSAPCRVASHAH